MAAFKEDVDFSAAWDSVGISVTVVAASMEVSVGADSAVVWTFSVGKMPVAVYFMLSWSLNW